HLADRARRSRLVPRAAEPVPRHALSLANRRARNAEQGHRDQRLDGGRRNDGAAPPRVRARGCAVPSRVVLDRARARAAAQLPRASARAGPARARGGVSDAGTQAVSFKDILAHAVSGAELAPALMEQAFDTILRGEATPAQIGGLLIALRMKGESASEVAAAARAMRRHAQAVKLSRPAPILHTCGTDGDGSNSFNISTVNAIVMAAAGVTV